MENSAPPPPPPPPHHDHQMQAQNSTPEQQHPDQTPQQKPEEQQQPPQQQQQDLPPHPPPPPPPQKQQEQDLPPPPPPPPPQKQQQQDLPPPSATKTTAAPTPQQQQPSRKRKVEHTELFHNSYFFKIRSIVKDLRPYFVEVLHAANFRECKAAHEIRTQMQVMMDLYKGLRAELVNTEKPKKQQEVQDRPNSDRPKKLQEADTANGEKLKHQEETQDATDIENLKEQQESKEMIDIEKLKEQVAWETVHVDASQKHQEAVVPEGQSREQQMESLQGEKSSAELEKATEMKPLKDPSTEKQQIEGIRGSYVVGGSPAGWNFMTSSGGTPTYYGETKESRAARVGLIPTDS